MRVNMPITNVERVMRDGEYIVSRTDTRGVITYVNPYFVEISGFSEAELIGAPHNIIRHPDMPAEAFKDLWETVQAGKPWTGIVKNRCKNGDHYWVLANVTPIWENGQITGYLSVRSKPGRAEVEAASQAYAKFKNGQAKGLTIREGKIVRTGFLANLGHRIRNLSIRSRIWAMVGMFAIFLLAVGLLSLDGLSNSRDRLRTVYTDRVTAIKQLKSLSDVYAVSIIDTVNKANVGLIDAEDALAQVRQARAQAHELWREYRARPLAEDESSMAGEAESLMAQADAALSTLESRLVEIQGNASGELTALQGLLYSSIDPITGKLAELIDHQLRESGRAYAAAETSYHDIRNFTLAAIVTAVLLGVAMAWLTLLTIVRPMQRVASQMREISQGNYNVAVFTEHNDEVGAMTDAFRSLYIRLGFDLAESRRQAREATRIMVALDNSAAAITISGADGNLIYMTPVARQLLNSIGGPGFDASKLIGQKLSNFFDEPQAAAKLDAAIHQANDVDFLFRGHHLRLAARPILSVNGETLGRVSTWTDRTAEVAVETEVAELIEAAAAGDLSRRINLEGKEGFFHQLSQGINRLLDTTEHGMRDVARVLKALAEGDLTQRIEVDYQGLFGELKEACNTTSERLREIVSQIREATDTINTAAREIASGNADLSSRTEAQASSLQETASSMDELTSTVKQNAENARQANQLAQGASSVAVKGGEVVGEVVQTMGAIAEASKKIADIISVIDGIAFQTNILALNAAVEAARAGEQGRGFAVVAGEVRNLAQRSAAAAKEIKALISDSVDKVDKGYKLVEQAGRTMDEIVQSVRRVTDIMAEITAASVEQSHGIEQVNVAVAQMDEMTQQNAALVEEAAAAAESLQEQADALAQAVAVFKTGQTSTGAESGSPHPARQLKAAVRTGTTPVKTPLPARAMNKSLPKMSATDEDEWEEF